MKKYLLLTSVSLFSLCLAFPQGVSAGSGMDGLLKTVERQKEQLARQEKEISEQKRALRELEAKMSLLGDALLDQQRAMGKGENSGAKNAGFASVSLAKKNKAAGVQDKPAGKNTETVGTETVGLERKPQEKDTPPEVPALSDEVGVLLAPGSFVIEPSLEYSRSSAIRVAIEGFTIIPALNIGSFEISEVDRDTLISAVSTRFGLTKRLEAEVRVPFVYREDKTLSRPLGVGSAASLLSEVDGMGLGDIEVAGRYQINDGKDGWPFFIGGLRFKAATGTDPFEVPVDAATGLGTELPTGSGFYALQPTLTAIFPSDPVVFYSNLGYLYNMKRDINATIGEVDPGDSVSFGFGMGFSANERASFSLGYSHDWVFETTRNGAGITNSSDLQVGSLNLGFAYRLNDKTNLNFNIGAGLTDDAPDARLIFRVPFTFNLY